MHLLNEWVAEGLASDPLVGTGEPLEGHPIFFVTTKLCKESKDAYNQGGWLIL